MTVYGFRLFESTILLRNAGRTKSPYYLKDGWSYIDHLCKALKPHIDVVHRGLPHDSDKFEDTEDLENNEDYRKLPLFRLVSYKKVSNFALLLEVESGRRSGHSNAMADPGDPEAEDLDIANHYPARTYRALLMAPPVGKIGVLAVESISRACPQAAITKWFSYWSELHADKDSPDSALSAWWSLKAKTVTDEETQNRFIQSGNVSEIRVSKRTVSEDRKRTPLDYSLISKTVSTDQKMDLGALIRGWFASKKEGKKNDNEKAAKEVAAIISRDFSEVDFTDVEVSVIDPVTNQRKTMKPNDFADVFVYPVCEDRTPDEPEFLNSIRGRVKRLLKSLKTSLDWSGFPETLSDKK